LVDELVAKKYKVEENFSEMLNKKYFLNTKTTNKSKKL